MGFEDSAKQKTKGLINVQVCVEMMKPFVAEEADIPFLNVVLKLEIALEKNIVFLTAQQCSGGITHFFCLIQQERFKWQAQPQAPPG